MSPFKSSLTLDKYLRRVRELNDKINHLNAKYKSNPARNENLLSEIHRLEIEKQTLGEAYTFNEQMSQM